MATVEKFYPNGKQFRIIDPFTFRHVDEDEGVVIIKETRIFYTRMEKQGAGEIREQRTELEKPVIVSGTDATDNAPAKAEDFTLPKLSPEEAEDSEDESED